METFIDIKVVNEYEEFFRDFFNTLEIRIDYEVSPSRGWIGHVDTSAPIRRFEEEDLSKTVVDSKVAQWVQNWIDASHEKFCGVKQFVNINDHYRFRGYQKYEFKKWESSVVWIAFNLDVNKNHIMLHPLHKYVMWY